MKKPSVSKRRAILMAMLAAFIACHPAMVFFGLTTEFPQHADKISQLQDGTYSIGRAISATLPIVIEWMAAGSVAFFFTLPIALLFGLPAHALLIKSGFWKKRHYGIAGAAFGTAAYIYFIKATNSMIDVSFSNGLLLLQGTFTGIFAAVLFRLFMGNKGNPDGLPATWHSNLFETPNLPENMPIGRVISLCIVSGFLLLAVSFSVATLAHLATHLPLLGFALFGNAPDVIEAIAEPIKYLFNQRVMFMYAIKLVVASVFFTGIYFTLRRLKKTGWIAFAIAGLIDGPIVSFLLGPVPTYGPSNGWDDGVSLIEGMILSAFIFALTAILFRALLGRMAAKEKGRNVSVPAS